MAKYTNISDGPRGAYLKGQLVMAEKGETINADDAPKGWFKRGGKSDDDEDEESGEQGALPRNAPKLRALAKAEEIDLGEAKNADDYRRDRSCPCGENRRERGIKRGLSCPCCSVPRGPSFHRGAAHSVRIGGMDKCLIVGEPVATIPIASVAS